MANWRSNLEEIIPPGRANLPEYPEEKLRSRSITVSTFIAEQALPAYEELWAELTKFGREVNIIRDRNSLAVYVNFQSNLEFEYRIVFTTVMSRMLPEVRIRMLKDKIPIMNTLVDPFESSNAENPLASVVKDDILAHFFQLYEKFVGRGAMPSWSER